MPVQPRFRVKFLLKFKYENVVRLAFQKKFYSKTRMDGHITIREKSVFAELSLLVIHKYIAFSFMIHSSWFMRACLVYIKIIRQQIFIAEFRELSKGQKISVSREKKYFTSWWQPIVYHEKLQAFCTWWKLCRHFEFCEVMFGLRKKNLKEKSFLWCLRKLVRLCAEDVGHT